MRFSVFAILLVLASVSAAAANENENENQRSHQKLRRRVLNEQQQVSLQVNLAANCQVETTQFCSNLSSCVS
jgi:hypothetical protein